MCICCKRSCGSRSEIFHSCYIILECTHRCACASIHASVLYTAWLVTDNVRTLNDNLDSRLELGIWMVAICHAPINGRLRLEPNVVVRCTIPYYYRPALMTSDCSTTSMQRCALVFNAKADWRASQKNTTMLQPCASDPSLHGTSKWI